jgi:hypothetical protein
MRVIAVAILLVLHGVAHLVGFAAGWHLLDGVSHDTTLLNGAVDVGDLGMRVAGVVWLALALAFMAGAAAVAYRAYWWPAYVVFVATLSLLMCFVAWPAAQAGAALNGALIIAVVAGMRLGWFDLTTR